MKKASVLAIVIVFVLSLQITKSEYWVKTGIPSVEIKALAFCDNFSWKKDNALIAITKENKIYRIIYDYYDNEKNFEELIPSIDSIEYTSIATLDSIIYLGTNKNGIFYSYDLGNSWEQLTQNIGNEEITSISINEHFSVPINIKKYILAGTKNGLYISYDFANQWNKLDNALNGKEIYKIFTYDNLNHVGIMHIFVSTNDSDLYVANDMRLEFVKTIFPDNAKEKINSLCISRDEIYYSVTDSILFNYDNINRTWQVESIESQPRLMNSILSFEHVIVYGNQRKKTDNDYQEIFPIMYGKNFMVSSIDKGIMIYPVELSRFSWYDANDGLNNKSTTTVISKSLNSENIFFAGTKYDGVYKLEIINSVDFSNDNSTLLTIAGSNDWLVKLKLNLMSDEYVNLELYDLQGNKVKDIFRDYLSEGTHSLDLDISGLQSGIYFIKLQMNGKTTVIKKMMVAR